MLLCNLWKLLDSFSEFPKKFWTLSLYRKEQHDLTGTTGNLVEKKYEFGMTRGRVNYLLEVK